jgi:creatinine amidohydrolase
MLLSLMSWPEVEDFLTRSNMIVIPIGSTEQHGPTGLMGTDAICPTAIAERAAEERPGRILVGPTFSVGSAQHHLGFAGTITLRPSTMVAAMGDWISSLARHGFRNIYWLNGHGGNVAPAQAAFADWYAGESLTAGDPRLALAFRNWWDLPGVYDMCVRMYGKAHGAHATPSEVAVTYAVHPEVGKRLKPAGKLDPEIAPSGAVRDAADYRRRFPDGRIGSDPTLATVEDGHTLIDAAAKGLMQELDRFAEDALSDD